MKNFYTLKETNKKGSSSSIRPPSNKRGLSSNSIALKENNENQFPTDDLSSNRMQSSKKRKLSMSEMSSANVDLEQPQFVPEKKSKKFVKKPESEKRQHGCNDQKILELEDTVTMQEAIIAKHKKEKIAMNFIINGYVTKIKSLEDEKEELKEKVQELNAEIATIKTKKQSFVVETCQKERKKKKIEEKKLNDENVQQRPIRFSTKQKMDQGKNNFQPVVKEKPADNKNLSNQCKKKSKKLTKNC